MNTISQHMTYDVKLSDQLVDSHINIIKQIIYENFTVIKETSHKFSPEGETIVLILSESHCTIHTYPEHNYISIDIYICNETQNLDHILELFKLKLPVLHYECNYKKRGFVNYLTTKSNIFVIYFLTMITAFCSMIYEFLMAETLSSILGNTLLRYNITIGLFVASMGIGSLLYNKFLSRDSNIIKFIKIEFLLSILGFISPILCLLINYISIKTNSAQSLIPLLFYHILIILIGLLAGSEIPLLIDIVKQIKKSLGKILFFDYLGCVIGSILFPFVFLNFFNIFEIGAIISSLNLIISLVSMKYFNYINKKLFYLILMMLITIVLFFIFKIDLTIIKEFYA